MADGTVWGLDANAVTGMAGQNGGQIMLNPQQQAQLAQQQANQAAQAQQQLAQQNAVFGMQMGNQAENLNKQRQMALNAQANAATNVANQLNQLGQARAQNSQLIQGAMQGAAGLFR
jgi:hypothetical protein